MGSKNPKSKPVPAPTKTPRKGFDENPNRLKPAWRIGAMEMRDPFGWHTLSGEELFEIHAKLRDFESMTLQEILGPRHHRVPVQSLCKEATDRLAELHLDDIEELLSLRLTATQRIWGVLEHNVVILLWWDPDHQVCPSLKKNT